MPRHLGFSDSVNLTISLCLTYTLCVSCVRLWIRKGAFGADDMVIAIATLVTLGHTAADYAAVAYGLGTPWTHVVNEQSLASLNTASIAGIVTFIIALYLSKCAMIAFLSRITKTHAYIAIYHISNALTAVLGLASVLVVFIDCPAGSSYYWAFHDNRLLTCPSQSARWQALTAFDIVTEILLLVLPLHLISGLHMRWGKKIMIIAAFYLRIPVIGLSIGRNYYTLQLRLPGVDAGLTSGLVVIWLEVQLAYAVAVGTLSASKAFTESFNSGFGLGFTRGKGDDTYNLSDMSGKIPTTSKDEKSRNDSALESGGDNSRTQSPPPRDIKIDLMDPIVTPIPPAGSTTSLQLKLRPEGEIESVTQVTADGEMGPWREHSSNASEGFDNGMFIVRETGYGIQHDQAPILRY